MSLTPWGGLELSGITIARSASSAPGNFREAKTFRLRVRLLSLFSKRLVIKEVALVKPTVVWPQDAEGKWRLPGPQEAQSPAVSTQSADAVGQLDIENTPVTKNAVPVVPATSTNVPPPTEDALHNKPPRRESGFAVAPEVRRVGTARRCAGGANFAAGPFFSGTTSVAAPVRTRRPGAFENFCPRSKRRDQRLLRHATRSRGFSIRHERKVP